MKTGDSVFVYNLNSNQIEKCEIEKPEMHENGHQFYRLSQNGAPRYLLPDYQFFMTYEEAEKTKNAHKETLKELFMKNNYFMQTMFISWVHSEDAIIPPTPLEIEVVKEIVKEKYNIEL